MSDNGSDQREAPYYCPMCEQEFASRSAYIAGMIFEGQEVSKGKRRGSRRENGCLHEIDEA